MTQITSAPDTLPPRNVPPQKGRSDPDADVLQALAAGHSKALTTLMERHLPALKSMAWHMVGDEMIAEDITQEAFIKAWKTAPTWQPGAAKFSTWLYRVTKNLCYDYLRKKREIYSDNLPEHADDTPGAHQMMTTKEVQNRHQNYVQHAISKLPKRQMSAIILCHYQNKSQIEAAAIMEINVRAYESLLARGRQNLRTALGPHKKEILGNMGDLS